MRFPASRSVVSHLGQFSWGLDTQRPGLAVRHDLTLATVSTHALVMPKLI
jgi:hypothetical protein